MKKFIFLLLMAFAMVGLVSAFGDTADPPGVITLEAEIACFGAACGCPVHQVTVLAECEVVFILPAGELALSVATIENPINLWEIAAGEIKTDWKNIDTGQEINYFLRL